MLKKIFLQLSLWFLAFVITVASAVYQRKTGPTYPISGTIDFHQTTIEYTLNRSHQGPTDLPVEIEVADTAIAGTVVWRRYPTQDEWSRLEMKRYDEKLVAFLPNQPPAGKLEYHVELRAGDQAVMLPQENNAIIRYTGLVPDWALIPHVLFMFLSMLLAARTAMETFRKNASLTVYAILTTVALVLGGFIFGPIVQKFAFGEYWTGFPFGMDLTDNKTLIALIGWVAALISLRKAAQPRWWVFGASIVMLIIFLIPHSMLGSELDYSTLDAETQSHVEIEKPLL